MNVVARCLSRPLVGLFFLGCQCEDRASSPSDFAPKSEATGKIDDRRDRTDSTKLDLVVAESVFLGGVGKRVDIPSRSADLILGDGSGGTLELFRAEGELVARRLWDDGLATGQFSLKKSQAHESLVFVDGVASAFAQPTDPLDFDAYIGRRVIKVRDTSFELEMEAWVLDLDKGVVIRPKSGREYRALGLGASDTLQERRPLYGVLGDCGRAECVYLGDPVGACRDATMAGANVELRWIVPNGCLDSDVEAPAAPVEKRPVSEGGPK